METKTFTYLELEDDKTNIDNFIKEEIRKNPIDVYVDYRDFEGLQDLVLKCDTKDEFCDHIYEAYQDYIGEEEYELARLIAYELIEKYEGYDYVSSNLYDYIQQSVWDYDIVSVPYEQFLRQQIRVNLFVSYYYSDDAFNEELDYTTLAEFIKRLGYSSPKRTLKRLCKPDYRSDDRFLDSLHQEIINSYPNQINHLCFIGKITIEDYYKLSLDITATVTFPKDVTCGFVDPYNGGGSILGIIMPKEFTVKGSNVDKIIIERTKQKYSVDSIYGLVPECYVDLKVN